MYVNMHACMYVFCMYVGVRACICTYMHVFIMCTYVCMNECTMYCVCKYIYCSYVCVMYVHTHPKDWNHVENDENFL